MTPKELIEKLTQMGIIVNAQFDENDDIINVDNLKLNDISEFSLINSDTEKKYTFTVDPHGKLIGKDESMKTIEIDFSKIFEGNTFDEKVTAINKFFDIKDDGSVDLSSCKKVKFIDKVQGISFYEKDGFDYLLVSTSYGQRSKSELKIFKYDDMCSDYTDSAAIKMDMPPMMEQITFNSKGNLIAIFESNASKFKRVRKRKSGL